MIAETPLEVTVGTRSTASPHKKDNSSYLYVAPTLYLQVQPIRPKESTQRKSFPLLDLCDLLNSSPHSPSLLPTPPSFFFRVLHNSFLTVVAFLLLLLFLDFFKWFPAGEVGPGKDQQHPSDVGCQGFQDDCSPCFPGLGFVCTQLPSPWQKRA